MATTSTVFNAVSSFKTIDLNRFRKIYPFSESDSGDEKNRLYVVEIGTIDFTASATETFTFSGSFSNEPTITITANDTGGNDLSAIRVYVSSATAQNMTVVGTSAFTGIVNFHAIEIL